MFIEEIIDGTSFKVNISTGELIITFTDKDEGVNEELSIKSSQEVRQFLERADDHRRLARKPKPRGG